MKKIGAMLLALCMVLTLASCGGTKVDYGKSEIYTREELDAAMALVKETFEGFGAKELRAIRYAGDESSSEDNLAWLNDLDAGNGYVQACEILTDFLSGENGVLEPNTEYKDYQWWLARAEGGEWQLISWGY